jgi:hypothetical protein
MAEILPFPAGRRPDARHRAHAAEADAAGDRTGGNAWEADDPGDDPEDGGIGLARVAGLAAAPPAPSLDARALRVEVLAARLAPPDGDAGAGLCAAEARLLRAVLRDLRALAADLAFAAARGAPAG